jgi:molybdate transport system substrate-binding protein
MRGGVAAVCLLTGVAALSEVAKSFEAETGNSVRAKYGPSGLLKDEIAGGACADVFASANMEHPQALSAAKKSGPVQLFARNRLCALVKAGLKVDSPSLLERMLDPAIKLATSTPKADPSGDYALEVFAKAESIRPGARAALEKKAAQLTGSADSAQPPAGRNAYGWHVGEGRADIFLAYCTAAHEAQKQNPEQQVVQLPERIAVGADYGLTVITGGGGPLCAIHPLARRTEDPDQLRFRPRQIKVMLMKLSARNQLKGKIVEVKKGVTTTHVRIDIGGQILTASITNEAADELKLAAGQTAYAVIKATSVMVAVD